MVLKNRCVCRRDACSSHRMRLQATAVLSVGLATCALSPCGVLAQVLTHYPNGMVSTSVPAAIVQSPDGVWSIEYEVIGPVRPEQLRPSLRDSVSLFTIDSEGRRAGGMVLRLPSAASGKPGPSLPSVIRWDSEASRFVIDTVKVTPIRGERTDPAKDLVTRLNDTEIRPVPVVYSDAINAAIGIKVGTAGGLRHSHDRNGWTISYSLLGLLGGLTGLEYASAQTVAGRVVNRFQSMLSENSGNVSITVGQDGDLTDSQIAATYPAFHTRPYSTINNNLAAFAAVDNEGFSEELWYANLPGQLRINTTFENNRLVQDIIVLTAIGQKWNISPGPFDAQMYFNPDKKFDYDPWNGIDDGSYSFEAVLYHESMHALGFSSNAGNGSDENSPHIFDIFRLNHESVGDSVNPLELFGEIREMRHGFEAISALANVGVEGAGRMSTGVVIGNLGDGYQSDHWKYFGEAGVSLGLMDPRYSEKTTPGYFSFRDLRALDVVGWNMSIFQGIILPPSLLPLRFIVSSLTPELSWSSNASGSDSQVVAVYLGSKIDGTKLIWESEFLAPSVQSVDVPSGKLVWGQTYALIITTVSPNGFAYSELGSFTARNPSCPCDFNGDGVVDDLDFGVFVVAYDVLDCADPLMPQNCVADVNNDGNVDDADFAIFVVAYDLLLCP